MSQLDERGVPKIWPQMGRAAAVNFRMFIKTTGDRQLPTRHPQSLIGRQPLPTISGSMPRHARHVSRRGVMALLAQRRWWPRSARIEVSGSVYILLECIIRCRANGSWKSENRATIDPLSCAHGSVGSCSCNRVERPNVGAGGARALYAAA